MPGVLLLCHLFILFVTFVIAILNAMPQVTIQYKSDKTLQVLMDIAKYFDFTIKVPKKSGKSKAELPIEFAEQPDITALAGIWKGKSITVEELRKDAWGERL